MDLSEKLSIGLPKLKKEENFGFRLVTTVQSDPITPIKFNDEWKHKDQEQCGLWREAICKELNSMNEQNVRNIVPMIEILGEENLLAVNGF